MVALTRQVRWAAGYPKRYEIIKQKNIEFSLRPASVKDIEFIFQLRVKTMKQLFKDIFGWNDIEEREKAAEALSHARVVMFEQKRIGGVIKFISKTDEYEHHCRMCWLPE